MLKGLKQLPHSSGSLLLYGGLLLGSLALFLSISKDVGDEQVAEQRDEDLQLDRPAMGELKEEQSSGLTRVARAVSYAGSGRIIVPLTAVTAAWLWHQEKTRAACFISASVGGSLLIEFAIKSLLERHRPKSHDDLTDGSGASFPSGHVTASTALVLALLAVVEKEYPPYHKAVATLGIPFALGVGVSRPYLQVHFPSDALAGHALSTAWVLGANLWYRHTDELQTESQRDKPKEVA